MLIGVRHFKKMPASWEFENGQYRRFVLTPKIIDLLVYDSTLWQREPS